MLNGAPDVKNLNTFDQELRADFNIQPLSIKK